MKTYKNLIFLMQIGINMSLPILVGVLLGKWIDDYFSTSPIFLLACIIIFTLSAFLSLFRIVKGAFNIDDNNKGKRDGR